MSPDMVRIGHRDIEARRECSRGIPCKSISATDASVGHVRDVWNEIRDEPIMFYPQSWLGWWSDALITKFLVRVDHSSRPDGPIGVLGRECDQTSTSIA